MTSLSDMRAIQTQDIDKSGGFSASITRKLARIRHRRMVTPKLDQPIVSFTFDDCPKSVVETALPLLEVEGWRATIYVACGLCDTINHLGLHMSRADIQAVAENGHEVGDHTYSHLDALQVSLSEFEADVDRNQATLNALGLPPSRSFAYPYGQVSPAVKQAMLRRFELSRGVQSAKKSNFDAGLSPATRLYSRDGVRPAIERVKMLQTDPKWEVLFTHDVRETPSDYGCTEQDLKKAIKAVKDSGARVMPVAEALDYIGGNHV